MDADGRPTISPSGNMEELLAAMTNRPYRAILDSVKAEKRAAEATAKRLARSVGRTRDVNAMVAYASGLRGLLYWLTHKRRSSETSFPLFRPLTEALIARHEFPPELLACFEPANGQRISS